MTPTEGYIKFECIWERQPIPAEDALLRRLSTLRNTLVDMGLIGLYPDGIGYGNVSIRNPRGPGFFITGTATGGLKSLSREHYAWVTDYSVPENRVVCRGLVQASSESLTHAGLYEARPRVGCVVHVHSEHLWRSLAFRIPTTERTCEYGTPELSEAIRHLGRSGLNDAGIIVLGGHEEGLLCYGIGETSALSQLHNAKRLLAQAARGAREWRFWNAGRWPPRARNEVKP